jgi:hypothetical protein
MPAISTSIRPEILHPHVIDEHGGRAAIYRAADKLTEAIAATRSRAEQVGPAMKRSRTQRSR